MDIPSKSAIEILMYLLPGLVTAEIVHNLTPAPRPAPFERVVQALIFTLVVQVLVVSARAGCLLGGRHIVQFGPWTENVRLVWSAALAAILGLILAHVLNTDRLHRVLRRLNITHQTSYSSEWYGALCRNDGFVVLHLSGQRRLYGWPEEWPSGPDKGHFVMALAEWLDEERRIALSGVEKILIRATDVEMVELMTRVTEEPKEPKNGRP
jgi:hypothetical protein